MSTLVLSCLFCCLVTWGCHSDNKRPADMPNLVPCKIKIVQEGNPVGGATVLFSPIGENRQWGPGGTTDASGVAELYTNGRFRGVPEGKYKIVVSKQEMGASRLSPPPSQDSPAYAEWEEKAENEERGRYSLVEKKYGDPVTTPLEIEVSSSNKSTEKEFDVGKRIKEKL